MFYMTMNNKIHTLNIADNISRTAAIKLIKETLSEHSGVILVDVVEVRFPLHRDFFLVLAKKFPRDRLRLRLPNEKSFHLAESLGFEAEIIGEKMSFEKSFSDANIATHNMSMKEYFFYELRRGVAWLRHAISYRFKRANNLPHYKKNNWHTMLIISGLLTSMALLLFIFHFAISKTIISISPVVTVKPTTVNITYRSENFTGGFLDESRARIAKLKQLEIPTEVTEKFRVETIDPESVMNAQGTLTIYNELTTQQELRPQTRFVTADGIVYRTTDWIKIPPTRSINDVTQMGVVEVDVIADTRDESEKIVGTRGNIPAGTDLTIPGLKFNRENIYAKAKSDFVGGEDPKVHIVSKEELERFEKILMEKIKKHAREEVQKFLDAEKEKTGQDFSMLIADVIKIENVEFAIISGQKVGDVADHIDMRATSTVKAIVFDKKATINFLTQAFRDNLLKGTNKELSLHPETLRVSNLVSRNADDTEIKMTVEMNTATVFDFENPVSEGIRQLKVKIAGDSSEAALKKLEEETQIQDATIKNYPFWVGNVTSNVENIEFVIKK